MKESIKKEKAEKQEYLNQLKRCEDNNSNPILGLEI